MRTLIYILTLTALFFGCKATDSESAAKDDSLMGQINTLEQQVAKKYDPQAFAQLAKLYDQYAAENPENTDQLAENAINRAGILFTNKQYQQSIAVLEQALPNLDYPKRPEMALLLGSIYKEGLQDTTVSKLFYKSFLEVFPNHEKAAAITKDYGQYASFDTLLYQLGERIYNPTTYKMEYRPGKAFITSARNFTFLNPTHERSPEYLLKAAEVARSIGNAQLAITTYQEAIDRYPNAERTPTAIFMQGFIYDEDLNDLDKAREKLEFFLSNYPEHKLHASAQVLLDNLGKSEEELIQSFQKK